ncbi:hypothetical protein PMAYCL1PPCAC_10308, partial [Pristionchus mayeri]
PITFYFGKHLGRKFQKWFDQVVIRMLGGNMIVNYWWKRYANRPRKVTEVTQLHTYNPLSINGFQIPFLTCGSLMALGVLILVLEVIHKRQELFY